MRSMCAVLAVLCAGAWTSISAAADTAWPVPDWQLATPASQGMAAERLAKVEEWLKSNGSRTGLVVRHGRIVGEWYFDDARPTSQFLVYSTSKSFASTAAGIAIAEGKLQLDSTVGKFLEEAAPAEKKAVTVKQLLSMTTGIHNDPQFGTRSQRFPYAVQEAPLDHAPGTKWDYNNTGLAVLSPLLRKATGMELDGYLNEKLFQPIGIPQGDWTWDEQDGHTYSYSGLHITARSLARFGLLFANRGKWQDKQLISAAWVTEATGPSQDLNKSYGYLWWNNTTGKWPGVPADAYAALGKFDNSMLIVPSLDLVVLRQVGDDSANDRKMNIGDLWKLAVEAVEK